MIGLALSGGGSRAMAFHLGCLRSLNSLGLLNKVSVISTISGGSVIGAYYAYMPSKSFDEFESDIRRFLRSGFQRAILAELLKPRNAIRSFINFTVSNYDLVTKRVLNRSPEFRGWPSRTDLFAKILQQLIFSDLRMNSVRREMRVVIGACDLCTESAFRFGDSRSGSWRLGEMVDGNVMVALAVAASAAYPLFLPALDRKWMFRIGATEVEHRVLLSDGGIYDNLGFRVLEPERDPAISIHSFPCDYIIACNAGHGLASGQGLPTRFYSRVQTAFSMVHRLVGNAAMSRLHELLRSKRIKGFILPYLGQLDAEPPVVSEKLVARSEVIGYPTDFAAMSEEWIDRLSTRGEQVTRVLADSYLKDLLD
jgi:NTE family protein